MLVKFDTEKEWLEARIHNVNSTDVAALFGLHPYKSKLQLWMEKAQRVPIDFEENNFSKWGKRLQNVVGMGICEDRGWDGFDLTGYYMTHPTLRQGCSMDIRAFDAEEGEGFLEVKVAESFSEDAGWTATAAPIMYEFQIQDQMHLAIKNGQDIRWGAIGTLGRRQSTRVYMRKYDAALGQRIDDATGEFWDSIQADMPPPADYAVDGPLLESLRGSLRAGPVNLSGNPRAVALAEQLKAIESQRKILREQMKPLDAAKDAIKYEMYDLIGRNEGAIIGDMEIGARIPEPREERINYGTVSRRFDIKKRKK